MMQVTNADRVVFPEIGRTKGDVVAYYEKIAPRALPHVLGRPLSIRRYPKGLSGPGFFQKNVPAHYPDSIGRFEVPRSAQATKKHAKKGRPARDVTVYPVVCEPGHLAYLANQGAIELHVTTSTVEHFLRPDRLIVDLDPPPGAIALVRRAALVVRDTLADLGLPSVPVATGSKGYHVVCAIRPEHDFHELATALQKLAALLERDRPEELTTVFRVAHRGERVFVDWLRNNANATVVAPYSLRARPRATAAVPLTWDELETTTPDAFSIDDVDRLLDRSDPLAELAEVPSDAAPFIAAVSARFEASGIELETFDRFRS